MGKKKLYALCESSIGYGLIEVFEAEEIAYKECKKSFEEFSRFSKLVSWISFQPFTNQDLALYEMQKISSSICTDFLARWLKIVLPNVKFGKKCRYQLCVIEPIFGASITQKINVPCRCDEFTKILLKSINKHLGTFIEKYTPFEGSDLVKASISLAHAYSRAKITFDKKINDNHIIHSVSLLEDLNKTLNGLSQRVKEWYSCHFPELFPVCENQVTFCRVVRGLQNRLEITSEKEEDLKRVFCDDEKVKEIINLAKLSMGTAFSKQDLEILQRLSNRCLQIVNDRDVLASYIDFRMNQVAPNFTELIGSIVGAKLISHCGSFQKLAKCPASTIQVLGAEKALFRTLKSRNNKTPKYGIIFGSTWIQRTRDKDRGRMSRILSNKLAVAARIDCFSKCSLQGTTNVFGTKLREQLEERLNYWLTGKIPRTNQEVMEEAYKIILRTIPVRKQKLEFFLNKKKYNKL